MSRTLNGSYFYIPSVGMDFRCTHWSCGPRVSKKMIMRAGLWVKARLSDNPPRPFSGLLTVARLPDLAGTVIDFMRLFTRF